MEIKLKSGDLEIDRIHLLELLSLRLPDYGIKFFITSYVSGRGYAYGVDNVREMLRRSTTVRFSSKKASTLPQDSATIYY